MHIRHFSDAKPYEAPNHRNCTSLRLAGFEQAGPENFWLGCSHFLPGGGAGPDATPLEKVYFVLSGQLTVIAAGETRTAGPMDTVFIPAGEEREIRNDGNEIVTMVVAMPYPPGTGAGGQK